VSSEIIYHQVAGIIPAAHLGASEDHFLVMMQVGSSNCYETKTGRRAREWSATGFGTYEQVLTGEIGIASDLEGGMVRWKSMGTRTSPESYISRVRRMLAYARNVDLSAFGYATCRGEWVTPSFFLAKTDVTQKRHTDAEEYSLQDAHQMRAFFEAYQERGLEKMRPYSFVKVYGPRL
jgi:hypothetical protein